MLNKRKLEVLYNLAQDSFVCQTRHLCDQGCSKLEVHQVEMPKLAKERGRKLDEPTDLYHATDTHTKHTISALQARVAIRMGVLTDQHVRRSVMRSIERTRPRPSMLQSTHLED